MKNNIKFTFVVLILLAMLISGCAAPAATTEPTDAPVQTEETAAPEVTEDAAVPEPTEEVAPEVVEETTPAEGENILILATTTSTQDSGLLDVILPDFESEFGITVDVIAVGTGQAITLGEDGNADVLLVHARSREDAFMDAGHGVRREDVMYNDFVILGPADDPAGIKGMTSATEAFAMLAETESPFISRGDESGTHTKELSVWKAAGIEPAGDWYISSGQGMGEVLTMANEQLAYTLSDRATYLARTLEGIELEVVVEGDPVLFNPYGVIAVNPDKGSHIKVDLANQFIDWIISVPVQEKIAAFGMDDFGQSLFIPDSQPWRDAQPAEEAAALGITGLVGSEMAWTMAELQAMPAVSVDYTNKDGETSTYTGVSLSELLALATPDAGAAAVVFIASDGYSAEGTLEEVSACTDCIVAFDDDGSLRMVMPNLSSKLQVKSIAEIQVK